MVNKVLCVLMYAVCI